METSKSQNSHTSKQDSAGMSCKIEIICEAGVTKMSARKREICWDFGIPPCEPPRVIASNLDLNLRPGTIALVHGPSGSGKSTILQNIAQAVVGGQGSVVSKKDVTWVGQGRFPAGRAVVDAIAPRAPLAMAMEILTACGLGEPRLWIRPFSDLSDGEKFRASLARAIGRAVVSCQRSEVSKNLEKSKNRNVEPEEKSGGTAEKSKCQDVKIGRGTAENEALLEAVTHEGNGNAETPKSQNAKIEREEERSRGRLCNINVILCDEFTSLLHRRLAKAVAYDLRKLVTRHGLILVVATTHDDIALDLQPDQIIRLGDGPARLEICQPRERPISLRSRACVEPGSVRDYQTFGPMHYRHRDGLGFVDKVFLLRERPQGDALGILVFAHAPLELHLRNRFTRGRFVRNVRRLNRELRILRRLVMHPDVRGCGLGHWFVRQTLPRVGVRFVECLAAMGEVNPVFERAGMQRIGQCPLPAGRLALLARMKRRGIDPFRADFPQKIAQYPRVRQMVEETIGRWVSALHGTNKYKFEGKPPEELSQVFRQLLGKPPVYYLWDREGEFPVVSELSE